MNDPVNIEDNFNWYTFGQSILMYRSLPEMVDSINNHYEKLLIENTLPVLYGRKGSGGKEGDAFSMYYDGVDTENYTKHNFLPPAIKEWVESRALHYLEWNKISHKGIKTQLAWVNNYKAGDYNPLHDHGTKSDMGLSCIFYMKVPEQISNLGNPDEEFEGLNNASGATDGFTYLTWGLNGHRDVNMLRPVTESYVKPVEGTLIMFPSWLRHSVNPFFGEGERRTFSANISINPIETV